jgi:hypothetical protein
VVGAFAASARGFSDEASSLATTPFFVSGGALYYKWQEALLQEVAGVAT